MKSLRWGVLCVVAMAMVMTSGCVLPKLVPPGEYEHLQSRARLCKEQAELINSLTHKMAMARSLLDATKAAADDAKRQAAGAGEALAAKVALLKLQHVELLKEQKKAMDLQELAEQLKVALEDARKKGGVGSIENLPEGVKSRFDPVLGVGIVVPNALLFGSGKADLKKKSAKLIAQIAKIEQVANPDNILRICGFTDSDPIKHATKFPDLYALASERARAVLVALSKAGVQKDRMHILAFGPHKLVMDPKTGKEDKPKSRRVEIYFVPPPPEATTPAPAPPK